MRSWPFFHSPIPKEYNSTLPDRECVRTDAAGAQTRIFGTSPFAPADFEVLVLCAPADFEALSSLL